MSANVVVPPRIISRQARSVPALTNAGETFFASAGKMNFVSHSMRGWSFEMPRRRFIAAWVWVLTKPGRRTPPVRTIRSFGRYAASIAAGSPTARTSPPRIATAVAPRTVNAASIGRAAPATTTRSHGAFDAGFAAGDAPAAGRARRRARRVAAVRIARPLRARTPAAGESRASSPRGLLPSWP